MLIQRMTDPSDALVRSLMGDFRTRRTRRSSKYVPGYILN